MKKLLKDQKGQVMVEFGLLFPIFIVLMIVLLIHGFWIYNSKMVDRATREAALYLARYDDVSTAEAIAKERLLDTLLLSNVGNVSVYWSGDEAVAEVNANMQTFYPGLPKLLNPKSPKWVGTVPISKEARVSGEHQHTNSWEYN